MSKPWWIRWWYRWIWRATARAYYTATRNFGSSFYNYREDGTVVTKGMILEEERERRRVHQGPRLSVLVACLRSERGAA